MFSNDKENKRASISDIGEKMTEYSDKISSKHNVRELGINSANSFLGIQYSVDILNKLLEAKISKENEAIEGKLSTIIAILGNIINKCNDYLISHEPPSRWKSKNARKKLIEELLCQAKEDFSKISDTKIDNIKVKDKETTWKDVLSDLRTEEIDINGRDDIGSTRGCLSEILTIGKGDNMLFFKDEERLTPFGISMKETQALYAEQAGISPGSIISNRNVATSRLARLLGIENTIAKSSNAKIIQDGKNTRQGNIMKKAIGTNFETIASNEKKKTISGEGQRQLVCLQMLDTLSAQIDRHCNNYFYQTSEKDDILHIEGVQGFDNDLAFGEITDLKELPSFSDSENGQATLDFVDKEIANNILNITPELLRYTFLDLLSDSEIKALVTRLKKMQDAIKISMELKGKDFLKNPEDWNEETLQILLKSKNKNYLKPLCHMLEIE